MARGSTAAQAASNTANTAATTDLSNANSLFGPLSTMLMSEAAHPAGINPTTLARMDTAAEETAGGSNAAAAGQGGLLAARTRNAGGADAATAASARAAGEIASRGILANRLKSAELQEGQRRAALSGLNSLFAENLSGGNAALGQVAANVNANSEAERNSWNWASTLFSPLMGAGMAAGGNLAGQLLRPPSSGSGCWIAEALYGVDDQRTHLLRAWLNGPFRETTAGDLLMRLYIAIGRQVAWVARRCRSVRAVLRPLFELALGRARAWNAGESLL